MKYLKYFLGFLVILVIGFFLLGLIKPELSYDCEIIVDKPLAESWAVTQDQENMSDWLEGFKRVEQVSGTPGTVGAVSNVYFENNGQEMSIQETITEIVPDESISMNFASDFMDMDYKMRMESVNGKTKINTHTIASGNGLFSKSLMAVISSSIKGQELTNLANLKKVIEENNKNYRQVIEDTISQSQN